VVNTLKLNLNELMKDVLLPDLKTCFACLYTYPSMDGFIITRPDKVLDGKTSTLPAVAKSQAKTNYSTVIPWSVSTKVPSIRIMNM
jgi:hypothetical protein